MSKTNARKLLAAAATAAAALQINAQTVNLVGEGWRLDGKGEGGKGEISLPIRVPCDVQTVLFDAGKLVNPSWADNEMKAQWPGEQDWTYSREFDVSPEFLANDSIILRLEDCDTFATIKVNDEVAGVTSNRFMRYDFDVKRFLKPGRNKLSGFFKSPEAVAKEKMKQYSEPYGMANVKPSLAGGMPLIRKPGCHGGWDWGLAQMVVGFCGKVELIGAKAARIDYVYCDQDFAPDYSSVKVTVNVEAFAPKAGTVPFEVALGDETRTETRQLAAGMNKVKFEFTVRNPRLWWPVGHGEANLYPLSVKTADGGISRRIGLRKANVVIEKSENETSFVFEINGRRIFSKGVNMIPTDAFDARQEEKYRPLLEAALACNMNTVRIWGGGQFERDSFYELCDEMGLMVFHDFMFGCAAYPDDPEFLALVEAETRHQVKRLRDVASIVAWSGDNECIGSIQGLWGFDLPKGKERNEVKKRLVALHMEKWRVRKNMLIALMKDLDPTRVFWPASPCDGLDDEGVYNNRPDHGDCHTYQIDKWLGMHPRFCSEFGHQSYPSKETALQFVDAKDVNPDNKLFAYHQKSPRWDKPLRAGINDNFRAPKGGFSVEDRLYLSLVKQSLWVRRATEAWRTQMPHCMGTLIWQLNDNWPVASWSMIEFGGKWKPFMYESRRFFAPVAAFVTSPEKGVLALTAVNDGPKPVGVKVTLRLMTLEGETLKTETFCTSVEPNKAALLKKYAEEDFGKGYSRQGRFLVVDVRADDPSIKTYQSGWIFDSFKNLNLAKANVKMEAKEKGGAFQVKLSTDKPAFGVWVEAFGVPGEFSDDFLTLVPGEPRTITFKPRDPKTTFADFKKSLTLKHIRATY